MDSKEKTTSPNPVFCIFVLNNAVSGLVAEQIFQEAGRTADAGWGIIRAAALVLGP